ncbi:MAG TPA: hypothetical protein VK324_12390, partial [Tepidisphaeraceae bacterium]|nr:hypothetical protein [Tepidisphaeraceae bacterium]
NGTQKGIGLAIAGILLALSFGGYVLAKRASGYVAEREDRAAIGRLIIEWGDAVKAGRTDELYARFSENFRQRIPRDRFDQVMKSMRSNQLYGELQSVESNNLVSFEEDPTTGRKVAVTAAKMRFDKLTGDETFRTVVQFRKLPGGDQWEFDNAPELFPASPQGGPNPAGAPQPPGGVPEGPALPD